MALGAVAACDAPTQASAPAPPAAPQDPPVVLSRQQVQERSADCERKAREKFRRDSGGGAAEFSHHYNTALDACLYLLTVRHGETISASLVDVNENETYGEFLGLAAAESPPRTPIACRVESLYCASRGEWEVLVGPYMKE